MMNVTTTRTYQPERVIREWRETHMTTRELAGFVLYQ